MQDLSRYTHSFCVFTEQQQASLLQPGWQVAPEVPTEPRTRSPALGGELALPWAPGMSCMAHGQRLTPKSKALDSKLAALCYRMG